MLPDLAHIPAGAPAHVVRKARAMWARAAQLCDPGAPELRAALVDSRVVLENDADRAAYARAVSMARGYDLAARAARSLGDYIGADSLKYLRDEANAEARQLRAASVSDAGEFASPAGLRRAVEWHRQAETAERRANGAAPWQVGVNVSGRAPGEKHAPPRRTAAGGRTQDEPGSGGWRHYDGTGSGEGPDELQAAKARRARRHIEQMRGTPRWLAETLAELEELPRGDRGIYEAQRVARRVFRSPSLRGCGCAATGSHVRVKQGPSGAFVGGVHRCDSVAKCPVCATRIGARRAELMTEPLAALVAAGYSVTVGCFTVRHDRGHDLRQTFDVVQGAFRASLQGRAWTEGRDRLGIVGGFRLTEVTVDRPSVYDDPWMRSQWHPHAHWCVVHKGSTSEEVGEFMLDRWQSSVGRVAGALGVDRVTPERDAQWHEPLRDARAIAGYLTKALGAAMELSGSWVTKQAGGNRANPAQLLFCARDGSARAVAQLREYEDATDGRRMWSVFGRKAILAELQEVGADVGAFNLAARDDKAVGADVLKHEEVTPVVTEVAAPDWQVVVAAHADAAVLAAHDAVWVNKVRKLPEGFVPIEDAERWARIERRGVGCPEAAHYLLQTLENAGDALRMNRCRATLVQARGALRQAAKAFRRTVRRHERGPDLGGRAGPLVWVKRCESSDTG